MPLELEPLPDDIAWLHRAIIEAWLRGSPGAARPAPPLPADGRAQARPCSCGQRLRGPLGRGQRYTGAASSPSHARASARVRAFSGTFSRKLFLYAELPILSAMVKRRARALPMAARAA